MFLRPNGTRIKTTCGSFSKKYLCSNHPIEVQRYLERQLERWQTSFLKIFLDEQWRLLNLQKASRRGGGLDNSRTWMIYLLNDRIVEKVETMLRERTADDAQVKNTSSTFKPTEMNGAGKNAWRSRAITASGALSHALFTAKLKSCGAVSPHSHVLASITILPFEHFKTKF